MEPTILAYAAGLFDGEGSVSIAYAKSSNKTGKRYHRLQVGLSNTDPRPLLWLREHFGGYIGGRRDARPSRKASARWQTNSSNAEAFLMAIRPYLIVKAEQVDIALALRATKRSYGQAPGQPKGVTVEPVTLALEDEREKLRERLLLLNRRGA